MKTRSQKDALSCDTPTRFIPCYNPSRGLKTADTSLTRNLEETFKLKEQDTEQSVIEYFNNILQTYIDETVDELNSNELTNHKSLSPVQKKDSKSSRTETKIMEITVAYSPKSKQNFKSNTPQPQPRNINHVPKRQASIPIQTRTEVMSRMQYRGQLAGNHKEIENVTNRDTPRKISTISVNSGQSHEEKHEQLPKKPSNEYIIELFSNSPSKASVKTKKLTKQSMPEEKKETFHQISEFPAQISRGTVKGFDSFMMY